MPKKLSAENKKLLAAVCRHIWIRVNNLDGIDPQFYWECSECRASGRSVAKREDIVHKNTCVLHGYSREVLAEVMPQDRKKK